MNHINDGSAMNVTPTTGEPTDEQKENLFNEGFSLGENDGATQQDEQSGAEPQSQDQPTEHPKAAEAPPAYMPPYAIMPQDTPVAPAPVFHESSTPATKTVDVPDELAEELEALKALNPEAAALALEDSPEGASIRSRLEQYGPELAQDRAERVLWQREQAQQREAVEANRMAQAREAHNAAFLGTLQRDHPDYMAMLGDPSRRAEAAQYQQDVFDWITSKPYAEAAPLMEIAKSGRDPSQVSALLTQFERERGGQPKRPDPTGALAVPGRGAPVAPTGVGDKDNFDAGWDLNSSK